MNRCDCPNELDEEKVRLVLPSCAPRDRLLVELGFETGLRISELLGLRVGEVWSGAEPAKIIRLSRQRLKGGRGANPRRVNARIIALNARARTAIAEVIAARFADEPVDLAASLFPSRENDGGALGRRQAVRVIRGIFLSAGLPAHLVWAGHSLRRRFVRRLYDATGDINLTRVAVGHRWITTTQAYLGLAEEEAQAAILRMGEEKSAVPTPAASLAFASGRA